MNDWLYWDKPFIESISSTSDRESAKGLLDAAKYYKIVRNFKQIDEPYRFYCVQKILKSEDSVSFDNTSDRVLHLAAQFEEIYGMNAISASSKLLWLKFKSPIIIYDNRAYNCLKRKNPKLPKNCYCDYREAWLTEFDKKLSTIKQCCSELASIKKFTLAYDLSDEQIYALSSRRWFHERVFDKYLWFLIHDSG